MRYARSLSAMSILVLAPGAAAQFTEVFPPAPHAAMNFIPLGIGTTTAPVHACTQHQVFRSTLFSGVAGMIPVRIDRIDFAPGVNGTYMSDLTVRLGYTSAIPGVGSAAGGLAVPVAGGGGAPNAVGTMHMFFSNPNYSAVFSNQGAANFQMQLVGDPFVYDPALGNLLVEIVSAADRNLGGIDLTISRHGTSADSSRAYNSTRFVASESAGTGTRMQFHFSDAGSTACYANCDGSSVEPLLNVDDFTCFINEYASASSLPHEQQVAHYANCDDSTIAPVLNVDDFTCFINQFAQGCP
jgi:hypothetical protein